MTATALDPPARLGDPERGHPRRWATLAVMCLAVFVTVLDGTIVNVALPTLAVELGATTRQLQWIVDAYLLVFTGLLLAAGGLGDKFGRKRALMLGLVAFGATSAFAGATDSPEGLIAGRALMGIGAALIFPATLAIITNVFRDPGERAKAIGIWSAVSGMAVAAGPITGGWLLEHFWWGSVFFVNVPVVAVVVIAAWFVVPESKEHDAPRLDGAGVVLSIAAISTLVFSIIEAPEWGWLDLRTMVGFASAAVLLALFVWWELRVTSPMLPVAIFSNLRFSAASVAITSAFFALFGFIFLITQYFQLVRGYSPLEAGVRTLPVAFSIALAAVLAPRLVHAVGTTQVVRAGLASMALGFLWIGLRNEVDTAYIEIVGQMILLGVGLGSTTAPATESIMGSLSADKAGVGLGRQRHHPRARRHPRRGDHRQRVQLDLRPLAERRGRRVRRAPAGGAGAHQGVGRSGASRRPAARCERPAVPRPGERGLPVRPRRRLLRRRRRRVRGRLVREPLPAREGVSVAPGLRGRGGSGARRGRGSRG